MTLSKTQVDKLGDRLRRCEVPTDEDLRLLSAFREERRAAMDAVGAGLAEIVGAPARRLKTINSIVDKLRRESARLSQVQDIAGLRIVREMTRGEQDDLVTRILARFPDAKVFDRRIDPSHGYRAVHVVVRYDRHLTEVQVRTELQHRWAMLVERFADAWGQQIKYGEGPTDPQESWASGRTREGAVGLLPMLSDLIAGTETTEVAVQRTAERFPAADLEAVQELMPSIRQQWLGVLGTLAALPL